jgi:hypothetical protein
LPFKKNYKTYYNAKKNHNNLIEGWSIHAIPSAPGRQRQEDHEFEASMDYTARPCLTHTD